MQPSWTIMFGMEGVVFETEYITTTTAANIYVEHTSKWLVHF
jgi:hypothetical protein